MSPEVRGRKNYQQNYRKPGILLGEIWKNTFEKLQHSSIYNHPCFKKIKSEAKETFTK